MSGFQIVDEATLELADPAYAGAEIVCRLNLPLPAYRQILEVGEGEDQLAMLERGERLFVEHGLLRWNLEGVNGPLPLTLEGFQRLPVVLRVDIFAAWADAVVNPPTPLAAPSSNGSTASSRNRLRSAGTSSSTRSPATTA